MSVIYPRYYPVYVSDISQLPMLLPGVCIWCQWTTHIITPCVYLMSANCPCYIYYPMCVADVSHLPSLLPRVCIWCHSNTHITTPYMYLMSINYPRYYPVCVSDVSQPPKHESGVSQPPKLLPSVCIWCQSTTQATTQCVYLMSVNHPGYYPVCVSDVSQPPRLLPVSYTHLTLPTNAEV